ncbi:MAG TPA: hypothetical protein G4O06_06805, partial [Dehalococcoidia bacterium]|nr:hypothetical protein [Dehalococcoidia bacterium]
RPEVPEDKAWLLVGDCARVEGKDEHNWVRGCPLSKKALLSSLIWYMSK